MQLKAELIAFSLFVSWSLQINHKKQVQVLLVFKAYLTALQSYLFAISCLLSTPLVHISNKKALQIFNLQGFTFKLLYPDPVLYPENKVYQKKLSG